MKKKTIPLTLAVASALLVAGCGGDDEPKGSTDKPLVIQVRFDGDTVSPQGKQVDVAVGQPIELDVTADAPGEIHVHSSPEQELEYGQGTTTLTIKPITQPGLVEVESHALEKQIVELEVR